MQPYYQDEYATIYHCDCLEMIDRLEQTDAMITDPIYGVNVGENQSSKEKRNGLLVKSKYASVKDTKENYVKIVVPAIQSFLKKCKRAAVFGFAPNIFLLPHPDVIGGVYVSAGCGRNKWGWTTFMPVLFYGTAPNLEKGAKRTAMESNDSSEKNGHPTPKPISWMNWLVDLASAEDETIIDPFMGSGTTLVSAKSYGRKCIGIEIEEEYCEIAANRLRQEVLNLF